jgi:two-component system, sensor histidine kinase and response regulator
VSHDADILGTLRELAAGDDAVFDELAASITETAGQRLRELREAIGAGDAAALVTEAHTLRGLALQIKARELATTCAELERLGKRADLAETGPLLERLQQQVARLRGVLGRNAEDEAPAPRSTLVADDDDEMRALLRDALDAYGHEVIEAANGLEALWAIKHKRPWLVLLDLAMPRLGGLEVLQFIRDFDASIAVIVISAHATEEISARLGALGVPVLGKPVDLARLQTLLARAGRASGERRPRPADLRPPLRDGRGGRPADEGPRSGPREPIRARALLVEDDATTQKIAALMLRKLGCRVDVAASGREGVQMVMMAPYDVVFMDCEMPEIDGLTASAEIRRRQRETVWRVPIVAMTAHGSPAERDTALKAGMDDAVGKPVRLADLDWALKRWSDAGRRDGDAAGSAAASAAPALDDEIFAGLIELAGGPDGALLEDLVATFFEDAPARIAAMRAAVTGGDARGLKAAAHALKGGSISLGATAMGALCQELEGVAATPSLASATNLIGRVETELERVRAEMAQRRRNALPTEDAR